jgi:hypothetical protein
MPGPAEGRDPGIQWIAGSSPAMTTTKNIGDDE